MSFTNHHNHTFAEFSSLQSFLNSYLIGCRDYKIVSADNLGIDLPHEIKKESFVLVLFSSLYVPLLRKSETGFHLFSQSLFINNQSRLVRLSFKKFIERICRLENVDSDHSELFQNRIEKSQNTIIALLDSQKSKVNAARKFEDLSFKNTEQTLVFGHFAHPYPKLQEYKTEIAHDLEAAMNLKWCIVKKSILHCEHSAHFCSQDISEILKSTYLSENEKASILDDLGSDHALFPIHPFQYEILKTEPIFAKYLEEKAIIPLEENQFLSNWVPTTSMRTIYNEHAPWMLKFSLNIRLTNSIRVLQDNEVKRGIQVHEVFESSIGKTMLEDAQISPLTIIHEPLFLALKDENQNIIKNTIVVFRENPFYKENNQNSICLAALTQLGPDNITPLVCKIISKIVKEENSTYELIAKKWFTDFLDKTIIPLVLLQARHGIYLGAHQQNLIIKLDKQNYPEKSFYRDCQGSGYSQFGFEKFKDHSLSLNNPNGNVLPVDFANSLMGYYVFINSTLFTIKSIADGNTDLEQSLIHEFASRLKNLEHLHDDSFIDYVLNSQTILIKDNFECCLKNINENVIDNPLKIYKKMLNPFFQDQK